MARISLKQVLGPGSPTHPVMAALAAAIGAPVSVEDAAGVSCTARPSEARVSP
jgi:hypothetical protein